MNKIRAKCHHGYSKKSCKECAGERKIIKQKISIEEIVKQEISVDKAQAAVIVAALDWYDASRDWLDPNNSNSGRNLRVAVEKLIAAQRKKT